jgi:hypothetical protein
MGRIDRINKQTGLKDSSGSGPNCPLSPLRPLSPLSPLVLFVYPVYPAHPVIFFVFLSFLCVFEPSCLRVEFLLQKGLEGFGEAVEDV